LEKRLETFHGIAKDQQYKSHYYEPESIGRQEGQDAKFCDQTDSRDNY
jgi:hypothetical protein